MFLRFLILNIIVVSTINSIGSTLDIGLMANYRFEGNLNDSGPNSFHLNQGAAILSYTNGVNGQSSGALVSPNVSLTSSANAGLAGNQDHTIALWFKTDHIPTWPNQGSILGFGDLLTGRTGSGGAIGIDNYSPTGARIVYDGRNIGFEALNISNFQLNEWNHIALVYSGSMATSKIYLNGSLLVSAPLSYGRSGSADGSMSFGSGPIYLFHQFPGGAVDEVRLYNRALSTSEVALLPEPSALSLLAVGLGVVLRRRRRTV